MSLDQLAILVSKGESETLEFKKSTGLLRNIFATVCVFLNGDSGTVLIGVTSNGKVVGQGVSDQTRREIANEVTKLEPSARLLIDIAIIKKQGTINIQQIMSELENPLAKRTVQQDLNRLKTLNIVDRKGRGKATIWLLV